MVDLDVTRRDPAAQFWDEAGQVSAGMLGIEGAPLHFQPMAPHVEPEQNRVWFFSKKDSDLVAHVGEGRRAHFVVVGQNHDYYACCAGALEQVIDESKVEELWSTVVAAWFSGQNDPNLALLRFTPMDGEVWASSGNALHFGWEVLKSNVTDDTPDIGEHRSVTFK